MRRVDRPKEFDRRTIRRCDDQGGPTFEGFRRAMCHPAHDHGGPHQCATEVGDQNEAWWEWDG